MARRVHDADGEIAHGQGCAVVHQNVELAAIGGQLVHAKAGRKHLLHLGNARPDHQRSAALVTQPMAARQMIRVDVGFQDPAQLEPAPFDGGKQRFKPA